MTVRIKATQPSFIQAYHHTQDEVKGYLVTVGTTPAVFITEKEADNLGRYLLFDVPDDELPVPDDQS